MVITYTQENSILVHLNIVWKNYSPMDVPSINLQTK